MRRSLTDLCINVCGEIAGFASKLTLMSRGGAIDYIVDEIIKNAALNIENEEKEVLNNISYIASFNKTKSILDILSIKGTLK